MFFFKFVCKLSMCFFKFLMQIFNVLFKCLMQISNVFLQIVDANVLHVFIMIITTTYGARWTACSCKNSHCKYNSTHKRASSSTSSRSLLPAFRCLWSRTSCGPLLGLCLSHLKPPHCLDLQVGSTIACVSLFSSISRMISGLSLKSHSKWVNHSDNSLSKIHFSTAN